MRLSTTILLALIVLTTPHQSPAAAPVAAESATAKRWITSTLLGEKSRKPFSFFYGERRSDTFLGECKFEKASRKVDGQRQEHTLTWTDPATGLRVSCIATEYRDFPAAEWVVWFKNTGHADTPILQSILPLDIPLGTPEQSGPFTVYYASGSHDNCDDFQPHVTRLVTTSGNVRLHSWGGRSSDSYLPFFNVAKPDGDGIVVGLGWTGQWAASLRRAGGPKSCPAGPGNMTVQAGMEATHLSLHPGEEIRSPSVLLIFWNGSDWQRGQNLLRSVLLRHYSPKTQSGQPAEPPLAFSPHSVVNFENVSEANMLAGIEQVAAVKLPLDTWWIDAGWFSRVDPKDSKSGNLNWASSVGNPDPDPVRFPRGMKPVADAAHQHGMKFLLWFEPERVMPGTWLYKNHADWLIAPPPSLPFEHGYMRRAGYHLLDLGNPAARQWITEKLSQMIGQSGIDVYRQDFNMFPLEYWRWGEPADRVGMREIRHVMGLYQLWDDLLRQHPNLVIDNCASGGRRIDLEMLRRSFVLWRSDLGRRSIEGVQSQQFALSAWLPITGFSAANANPYVFRSGMGGTFMLGGNYLSDPKGLEAMRPFVEQYLSIRRLYQGDFYPLTPYTLEPDAWLAWQFYRDDVGEGHVQAFRRPRAKSESITVHLSGLDPAGQYEVDNLDGGKEVRMGRELAAGMTITLKTAPAAALYRLRAVKP
jgi:alpha-galactosidase